MIIHRHNLLRRVKFDTLPVTSGLLVNLEADQLVLSNNDKVTNWGQFEQLTVASKPTFLTNIINGKPVVKFGVSSANTFMQATAIKPTEITIISLNNYDTTATSILDTSRQLSISGVDAGYRFDNRSGTLRLGTQGSFVTISNTASTTYKVSVATKSTTERAVIINNSETRLSQSGAIQYNADIIKTSLGVLQTNGAGTAFDTYLRGSIAVLFVYDRVLTPAELYDVVNLYLNPKYGL